MWDVFFKACFNFFPPLVLSSLLCALSISPLPLSEGLFPVRIKQGSVLNPWPLGDPDMMWISAWYSYNFQFLTRSRNTCRVGLMSGSPSRSQKVPIV